MSGCEVVNASNSSNNWVLRYRRLLLFTRHFVFALTPEERKSVFPWGVYNTSCATSPGLGLFRRSDKR